MWALLPECTLNQAAKQHPLYVESFSSKLITPFYQNRYLFSFTTASAPCAASLLLHSRNVSSEAHPGTVSLRSTWPYISTILSCLAAHTCTQKAEGWFELRKPFMEGKLPRSFPVPWARSRIRCELANPQPGQLSAPSSGSAAAPPSTAAINVLCLEREVEHFCVLRRGAFSPVMHISWASSS